MKNNIEDVVKYATDQWTNGSESLNRVYHSLKKHNSKNESIVIMARRQYSHLDIEEVVRTAQSTIKALELTNLTNGTTDENGELK
jgi:hypothetical protein